MLIVLALVTSAALAQTTPPTDFSPPPIVPATPPPTPPPEPGATLAQPGTPPPPTALPTTGYVPGQTGTGYPYSPYGAALPEKDQKPPVEWGLMVSESLFGMLTSAGVTLIPYFLLLRGMINGQGNVLGGDPMAGTVIFMLIFVAVPLAVSQTQLSIANGSRHFFSESWPAALAGLGAEAAVLGLMFLLNPGPCSDGVNLVACQGPLGGRSEGLLLIGSIVFVPLVQMAVINLTKSPRAGAVAAISTDPKGKLSFGVPTVAPLLGQTRAGAAIGLQAQLINVRF